MGMNPKRAGGSAAYALTQHGLVTVADAYGTNTALMSPAGIVQGAAGAPSSSFGSKMVSAVPPTLRGSSPAAVTSSSSDPTANIPILGSLLSNVPGGTAVHLGVAAVLVFVGLKLLMKEE